MGSYGSRYISKQVKAETAAPGFRIKSDWATAVLLTGPIDSPALRDNRTIDLSDLRVPETRQPLARYDRKARNGRDQDKSAHGYRASRSKTFVTMFQIRSARPDDADFLGWVILTAARGHLERGWFDLVLQRDEGFCFEYCSKLAGVAARSWWHWFYFPLQKWTACPQRLCAVLAITPYTRHLPLRWQRLRKRWV